MSKDGQQHINDFFIRCEREEKKAERKAKNGKINKTKI